MGFLVLLIKEFLSRLKPSRKDDFIGVTKKDVRTGQLYISAAAWRRGGKAMPLELSKQRGQPHGREEDFRERMEVQNVRENMLRKEREKPVMPGKQADLQAIQLCCVKDYVSGRKSWKEKSIKICFYYYIFIYFILYYNDILKYLIKICKYTWPV